jgi:hypothetical protein
MRSTRQRDSARNRELYIRDSKFPASCASAVCTLSPATQLFFSIYSGSRNLVVWWRLDPCAQHCPQPFEVTALGDFLGPMGISLLFHLSININTQIPIIRIP